MRTIQQPDRRVWRAFVEQTRPGRGPQPEPNGLDLHLAAEFNDAFRRDAEVGTGEFGVARQKQKQPFAPTRHTARARDHNVVAAEKISGVVGAEPKPLTLRLA